MKFFWAILMTLVMGFGLGAQASKMAPQAKADEMPKEMQGIGITEHLGQDIDTSLQFKDEDGNDVTLGKYFTGHKPVFLGLVYYGCANLCNFFMNGVTDTMKNMSWEPGREFELLFVSIDPRENSSLAKPKKEAYLKEYGHPEAAKGWHFLTGSEENIKKLAAQVGFAYRWDEPSKQWAHVSAGIIATPGGKISRYLYGIMFEPATFKFSLLEASNNQIGTLMDRAFLFCFKFDPSAHKYSFYAFNLVRIAAILTMLGLALLIVPAWRREGKIADKTPGKTEV